MLPKELNEISACRVCCVEVEGEGKLVPSCNNVVREGMVIRTNSPRALEARRVNMELILSQHDNKCATCIRSGTCQLQKIANDMGILGVSYPTDLARGKKADWTTTFPALPRCKQVHQVHALHSGMRQSAVAVRLGYQRLGCAHHH